MHNAYRKILLILSEDRAHQIIISKRSLLQIKSRKKAVKSVQRADL